jgi:hypothetical protein
MVNLNNLAKKLLSGLMLISALIEVNAGVVVHETAQDFSTAWNRIGLAWPGTLSGGPVRIPASTVAASPHKANGEILDTLRIGRHIWQLRVSGEENQTALFRCNQDASLLKIALPRTLKAPVRLLADQDGLAIVNRLGGEQWRILGSQLDLQNSPAPFSVQSGTAPPCLYARTSLNGSQLAAPLRQWETACDHGELTHQFILPQWDLLFSLQYKAIGSGTWSLHYRIADDSGHWGRWKGPLPPGVHHLRRMGRGLMYRVVHTGPIKNARLLSVALRIGHPDKDRGLTKPPAKQSGHGLLSGGSKSDHSDDDEKPKSSTHNTPAEGKSPSSSVPSRRSGGARGFSASPSSSSSDDSASEGDSNQPDSNADSGSTNGTANGAGVGAGSTGSTSGGGSGGSGKTAGKGSGVGPGSGGGSGAGVTPSNTGIPTTTPASLSEGAGTGDSPVQYSSPADSNQLEAEEGNTPSAVGGTIPGNQGDRLSLLAALGLGGNSHHKPKVNIPKRPIEHASLLPPHLFGANQTPQFSDTGAQLKAKPDSFPWLLLLLLLLMICLTIKQLFATRSSHFNPAMRRSSHMHDEYIKRRAAVCRRNRMSALPPPPHPPQPGSMVPRFPPAPNSLGMRVGEWSVLPHLPAPMRDVFSVVRYGYLYALAPGCPVFSAPVGKNGELGEWRQAGQGLQHAGPGAAFAQGRGRVYAAFSSTHLDSTRLLSARFQPGGRLGSWREEASIPVGLSHTAMSAAGNHLILSGGRDKRGASARVYMTRMGASGRLRRWQGQSPLPLPLHGHCLAMLEGRLYAVGGRGARKGRPSSCVFSTSLQNGQLEPWQECEPLPRACGHSHLVSHGKALLLVGDTGMEGTGNIIVSHPRDGRMDWKQAHLQLPLAQMGAAPVLHNQTMFLIGGKERKTPTTQVLSCHLPA